MDHHNIFRNAGKRILNAIQIPEQCEEKEAKRE